MRIGMIKTVVEDHFQADGGPALGDLGQIGPGRRRLDDFRHLHAFHHFHGQHALGRQFGMGMRECGPWDCRENRGRTAANSAARGRNPIPCALPAEIPPPPPGDGNSDTRGPFRPVGPTRPGSPCPRPPFFQCPCAELLPPPFRPNAVGPDAPARSMPRPWRQPRTRQKVLPAAASIPLRSILRTASGGSAGALAWSCCNSSLSATPARSGRVLSSWPSLINVGPNSERANRSRVSQRCRAIEVPPGALSKSLVNSGPSRLIHEASSYLLSTASISYQRFRWR